MEYFICLKFKFLKLDLRIKLVLFLFYLGCSKSNDKNPYNFCKDSFFLIFFFHDNPQHILFNLSRCIYFLNYPLFNY